jgi:transcriptional repressor NrdR
MVCVHCGSETQVINSRAQKRSNQVWRRRRCMKCRAVFTTAEAARYEAAWAVRGKSGNISPFSRDKLFLSLYKSCGHRKTALDDAAGLTDTIIKKLAEHVTDGVVRARDIAQVAQVALNRFDKTASTHYTAFHKSSA